MNLNRRDDASLAQMGKLGLALASLDGSVDMHARFPVLFRDASMEFGEIPSSLEDLAFKLPLLSSIEVKLGLLERANRVQPRARDVVFDRELPERRSELFSFVEKNHVQFG